MNAEQIARICHEACRHYNETVGDPPLLPWSYAPEWQKASVIDGVEHIMAYPMTTPSENHANWAQHKVEDGWTYGLVKDVGKKTHPNLVPYEDLPEKQRTKDILFTNIVRALMPTPARRRPTVEELEDILRIPDTQVDIRADGTVAGSATNVTEWHRAYRGLPMKIGGYDTQVDSATSDINAVKASLAAPTQRALDPAAEVAQQEVDNGKGHAEDEPGGAAPQADRDGLQAAGEEGDGAP